MRLQFRHRGLAFCFGVAQLWTVRCRPHALMKKSSVVILVGIVVIIVCGLWFYYHFTSITVSVTCSEPSMRFAGTIVSDGHSQELSGTGSGTYHASGHAIICSFKKLDADGQISLAVSAAGKKLGDSSTPARFGGVRAELHHRWTGQTTSFTTF